MYVYFNKCIYFLFFKVHIRWCGTIFQMGRLGILRRVVLLFHFPEHHRVRWFRAGKQHHRAWNRFQSDQGCRAEFHTVLDVPYARHGPDRHVLQSDAAGRGDEDQNVHWHTEKDHEVQKLTDPKEGSKVTVFPYVTGASSSWHLRFSRVEHFRIFVYA